MKKAAILTALGLLVMANLALAGGGGTGDRVEGVIASIDADNMQIVVGDTVVQLTADTVIKMNGRVISFDDLAVGQTVAACGVFDGDTLVALRVTVKYSGR